MASYAQSTHNWATTDNTSRSASRTPTTIGDLIVIIGGFTGNTNQPTVSDDQGGTYTEVSGGFTKDGGVDKFWVWIRDQAVSSLVAHTVTMTPNGNHTGGGFFYVLIHGMTKTGAAAAKQVGISQEQGSGTASVTMPAAVDTNNPTLVTGINDATTSELSAITGWSARWGPTYSSPSTAISLTTRDSGFSGTTITFNNSSSTNYCMVVLELDASTTTSYTESATVASATTVISNEVPPNIDSTTVKSITTIATVTNLLPVPIVDNFNRADGSPGSNWALVGSTGSIFAIASQVATTPGSQAGSGYWVPDMFGSDGSVSALIAHRTAQDTQSLALFLQMTSPASSTNRGGYRVRLNRDSVNGDQILIQDNDVATGPNTLASTNYNVPAGSTLTLAALNGILTVYVDSVSVLSYDTGLGTIPAGNNGFLLFWGTLGDPYSIDDFGSQVSVNIIEQAAYVETATIAGNTSISATEVYTPTNAFTESATISSKVAVSSTETTQFIQSTSVATKTTPSTTELTAYSNLSTVTGKTTLSSTEVYTPKPQNLLPISDVTANSWQASDGVSPLYQMINETTPNDANYIYEVAV